MGSFGAQTRYNSQAKGEILQTQEQPDIDLAINVDMAGGSQFELPKLEPDQMFPPQPAPSNDGAIKQKNNVFYQ